MSDKPNFLLVRLNTLTPNFITNPRIQCQILIVLKIIYIFDSRTSLFSFLHALITESVSPTEYLWYLNSNLWMGSWYQLCRRWQSLPSVENSWKKKWDLEYICECVCVGGGWGDAIVWVGVYIIYYLLTYKQSISVCVGVGVTTISVCYVFLSILHQNARQSVEDLCTCTSRTH